MNELAGRRYWLKPTKYPTVGLNGVHETTDVIFGEGPARMARTRLN